MFKFKWPKDEFEGYPAPDEWLKARRAREVKLTDEFNARVEKWMPRARRDTAKALRAGLYWFEVVDKDNLGFSSSLELRDSFALEISARITNELRAAGYKVNNRFTGPLYIRILNEDLTEETKV